MQHDGTAKGLLFYMSKTRLLTGALPLAFRSLEFPKVLFHVIQNGANITSPAHGAAVP